MKCKLTRAMFRTLRKTFWFTVMAIIEVLILCAPTSDGKECLDLKYGLRSVLVFGMLSNRLVIISFSSSSKDDYQVHDLQRSALDSASHRIYVDSGVSVASRWPTLNGILSSFIFHADEVITLQQPDSGSVYVQLPRQGVSYKIDQDERYFLPNARPAVNGTRWISSLETLTFFALDNGDADRRPRDGTVIAQFRFRASPNSGSSASSSATNYEIVAATPWYRLCTGDDSNIKAVIDHAQCEHPLTISVSNGFADSDRFYLLMTNQVVHIFDRAILGVELGQLVRLFKVAQEDFIACTPQPPQPVTTAEPVTGRNLVTTIITEDTETGVDSIRLAIIGGSFLLFVLIVVVPCVFALCACGYCCAKTPSNSSSSSTVAEKKPDTKMADDGQITSQNRESANRQSYSRNSKISTNRQNVSGRSAPILVKLAPCKVLIDSQTGVGSSKLINGANFRQSTNVMVSKNRLSTSSSSWSRSNGKKPQKNANNRQKTKTKNNKRSSKSLSKLRRSASTKAKRRGAAGGSSSSGYDNRSILSPKSTMIGGSGGSGRRRGKNKNSGSKKDKKDKSKNKKRTQNTPSRLVRVSPMNQNTKSRIKKQR